MFKRQWKWFGQLLSDEGFTLAYGHRSITYSDERGSFQFGLEDGFLFSPPFQVAGAPVVLSQAEIEEIAERVVRGIKSEGEAVQVFPTSGV
jgi:hypothetical protein